MANFGVPNKFMGADKMTEAKELTELTDLGEMEQHFDVLMDIGEYFQEFQDQLAEFTASIFGALGL